MNKETFIQNLLLRCPVTLDHAAAKLGYKNAVTAIDGTKLEDELYKTHAYMCLSWATFYADALQTAYHDELFDGSFEVLDNQPMLVELPGEGPFVSEKGMLSNHEMFYARPYDKELHGKIPHREQEAWKRMNAKDDELV